MRKNALYTALASTQAALPRLQLDQPMPAATLRADLVAVIRLATGLISVRLPVTLEMCSFRRMCMPPHALHNRSGLAHRPKTAGASCVSRGYAFFSGFDDDRAARAL